jgi:hypothetical protein
MAADIRPFQNILTPTPIKEESTLDRLFRIGDQYKIKLDPNSIGIAAMADAFMGPKVPGFSEPNGEKEKLDYWAKLQKEQALERQRLGEESTQKALLYSTLAKLPDKLANAFNPYGSKEGALVYAAHLNNLPNVVNDTMRSIPMMNVQGVAYNAPQRQYFT